VDQQRAAILRAGMVERQLRQRGIVDENVLAAMAELPREAFVASDAVDDAYADAALPSAAGQTISQPYIVARMTEAIEPRPGMRVLEIGTGTGYQAAILAMLGCDVLSIERLPELAKTAEARLLAVAGLLCRPEIATRVRIEVGDGSIGHSSGQPFDAILVTAAAPAIPGQLRAQLADGGRLVIPVGPRSTQELVLVTRHGDAFGERGLGGCVFVPLVGEGGYSEASVSRSRWI
jgi:protein-L-isoaspartate(D-aspartate) O-methyltransferase